MPRNTPSQVVPREVGHNFVCVEQDTIRQRYPAWVIHRNRTKPSALAFMVAGSSSRLSAVCPATTPHLRTQELRDMHTDPPRWQSSPLPSRGGPHVPSHVQQPCTYLHITPALLRPSVAADLEQVCIERMMGVGLICVWYEGPERAGETPRRGEAADVLYLYTAESNHRAYALCLPIQPPELFSASPALGVCGRVTLFYLCLTRNKKNIPI